MPWHASGSTFVGRLVVGRNPQETSGTPCAPTPLIVPIATCNSSPTATTLSQISATRSLPVTSRGKGEATRLRHVAVLISNSSINGHLAVPSDALPMNHIGEKKMKPMQAHKCFKGTNMVMHTRNMKINIQNRLIFYHPPYLSTQHSMPSRSHKPCFESHPSAMSCPYDPLTLPAPALYEA